LRYIAVLALLATPVFAQKSVHYELSFPNAIHHEAEVRATFTGVDEPVLHILMSRSSPGRYALHEFAKNVYNVRATDELGRSLPLSHPDPYGWDASGHKGTVSLEYTVFGDRVDGTYAAIDETHAHLNMPAVLAWAPGFESATATLKFDIPPGSNWTVATQLLPNPDGTWSAPNLEWLMDSPVEIGRHDLPIWKIEGTTFRLALHHGGTPEQAAVFAEMCKAVVTEEEGVFGEFPKYEGGTYTFLIDYLPYASFDGMEHRDSTVITGTGNLKSDAYREIGTVSHEFFHSWNVKRIRPRSLEPFDFERADMSGELWFAEGFTSYYGPLALVRSGLSSLGDFAGQMGNAVNLVLTAPGRSVHNVVEMSRLAPFVDAAQSIDPQNFANTFISYYPYGEAIALGIDLEIRERFPGKTLDDWMRTMWREHPDIDKPYTLDDLQSTLAETTASKQFAHEVFQRHIYGTAPLDYAPLLAHAGLLLRKAAPGQVWLGARDLHVSKKGIEIASYTLRDSPLYQAGLDKGDLILKVDRKALKSEHGLTAWLKRHKPGDRIQVLARTRSGERILAMVLTERPSLEIVTYERAGQPVTPEIIAFRKAWLGSKALHPLPVISPIR
jgi:predicted metalloprotease with PDZ domain